MMNKSNPTEKVAAFILKHHLLKEHTKVVVGLSGGPDSVCLAVMLHSLGYDIIAAHCNFHLRGTESMRDEQFVSNLCLQYGLTYRKADFDTLTYAQIHQISIEMAAREQRYAWFRQLKNETGATAIVVGHHQDDNAETLLLNLTRGTGIKGLCAMQPQSGDVVRPLLCLTRTEILSYLQTDGLSYVTDHTNLEDEVARNKIRLNVLPILKGINPAILSNITSTIENLNEVQRVYRQAINAAIQNCCIQKENGELHIIILKLLQLPSPISLLHEVLFPLGFNKQQLKDILASLGECGKIFTANERRLLIDREVIIIESLHYPSPQICQEVLPRTAVNISKSPHLAYLDADKIHGSLTLRTPRTGDTFAPFGMHGKRKLLSDFLTNLKLSLFEKEHQSLLMDGTEIVWVVGKRSSELYRVDENTQRVVVLSMK